MKKKQEELKDKINKVLNTMEDSIKKNTKDEEELNRIQRIKDYLNSEEK